MINTVFITGASTGIGLASAKLFLEKGWNVVATMRSPKKCMELDAFDTERMFVVRLDVQDLPSIKAAVTAAIAKFTTIDLLVNNAGYGQNGLFESLSREQMHAQFDVNVFGLMDVTREMLPHFRENKRGGIINVSSGSGIFGLPMVSMYSASKFALEGFTESLAFEMASQNIFVKSIIPHDGVTSTNFNATVGTMPPPAPASYNPFLQNVGAAFGKMMSGINTSSDDVAQVIFEAATDGKDKLRYLVGDDTQGFVKARYGSKNDEEYVTYMRSYFQ